MSRYFLFIFLVGLIFFGLGYFVLKEFLPAHFPKFFFTIILSVISLAMPILFLVNNSVEEETLSQTIFYILFGYLGFISFGFSIFVLKEISNSMIQILNLESTLNSFLNRNEFLKIIYNHLFKVITTGFFAYGFFASSKNIQVKDVKIGFSSLHPSFENLRIVQISDVHIGPTIKSNFLTDIVDTINGLAADIVVITGDLVDGDAKKFQHNLDPLKNIKSKHGTFFVTGNHEYYSGVFDWLKKIAELGIVPLLNENKILNIENKKFLIAGVTDLKAGSIVPSHKTDPGKAIANSEESDFKLLLAHQPNSIFESSKYGYDLQLSGHTHGGQYFPANFLIYFFQKYVAGLYKHENTMLYVSRGTGYWGPPLRLAAAPEITNIKLISK